MYVFDDMDLTDIINMAEEFEIELHKLTLTFDALMDLRDEAVRLEYEERTKVMIDNKLSETELLIKINEINRVKITDWFNDVLEED